MIGSRAHYEKHIVRSEPMGGNDYLCLTPRSVAAHFGTTVQYLNNLRAGETGPKYFKVGHFVFYRVIDLLKHEQEIGRQGIFELQGVREGSKLKRRK